jgi:ribonuclease III
LSNIKVFQDFFKTKIEKYSKKKYDHSNGKFNKSNNKIDQIDNKTLEKLEKVLGYKFSDRFILNNSLTHSSISKVNGSNFERLEFLGDRILNFCVAKMLFDEYQNMSESEMTPKLAHMISRETLFKVSQKIELEKFAKFRCQNKEKKIFADMMESIIGAMYIDSGSMEESAKFIKKHWKQLLKDEISNPRSELQELLHKYKINSPEYTVEKSEDNIFTSKIKILIAKNKMDNKMNNDSKINTDTKSKIDKTTTNYSQYEEIVSTGTGKSIKIATTQASENAILKIKEIVEKK